MAYGGETRRFVEPIRPKEQKMPMEYAHEASSTGLSELPDGGPRSDDRTALNNGRAVLLLRC